MNPYLCHVVLRPRDPLETFDLLFVLLRVRFRALLRLTLLWVVPVCMILALAAWWTTDSPWVALAAVLVGPLVQAPFTVMGGRLLFADDVGVRAVLRDTLQRVGALFAAGGIVVLVAVATSLACFVPLPFVAPWLTYLSETALLERVGPQRGLRRAVRLTNANLGTALVSVVSRVLLTVWGALLAEGMGQAIFNTVLQLGQPFGSVFTGQVTPFLVIGIVLSHPLHALYRLLLYVDVRTREEGWDLQVGLRAAGLVK